MPAFPQFLPEKNRTYLADLQSPSEIILFRIMQQIDLIV